MLKLKQGTTACFSNPACTNMDDMAGDVAFRVIDAVHRAEQRYPGKALADADVEDQTRVYVCDINRNMLEVGKQRARERGNSKLFNRKNL